MRSVSPRDGWLEIDSPEGRLAFELGPAAEKWAQKILHPPSRLDKLGIKEGTKVALISLQDPELEKEIAAAGAEIVKKAELILFGAEKKSALTRLEKLRSQAPAIWIIYPKGIREITENDVIAAIRATGMKDVKVASFSKTHTALKAM